MNVTFNLVFASIRSLLSHPSSVRLICCMFSLCAHYSSLVVFNAIYTGLVSEQTGGLFFCPIDRHDQPVSCPPSLPPVPAWQS